MYIYFMLFVTCFILALISLKFKINDIVFKSMFLLMTIILAFRYGQGTDYFPYNLIFSMFDNTVEALENDSDVHGEVGFRLVCALIGDNFQFFVAVVSFYQCFMLYIFMKKYCLNKMLSLYLVFSTIYLTYFFSGIRQGIVIATFLGVGLTLIKKKAWGKYIIMCIALSLIHSVSLILLIIPIGLNFSLSVISFLVLIIISLAIGIFLDTGVGKSILINIPYLGSYLANNINSEYRWLAILEKSITLCMVLIIYYSGKNSGEKQLPWYVNIYLLGHIVYFMVLPFGLMSTRIIACFKSLEVMFIPNLIRERRGRYRQLIIFYFMLLNIILYAYHVNGYIEQGGYFEEINWVNYPYVSIFNKDDIWRYRGTIKYYKESF